MHATWHKRHINYFNLKTLKITQKVLEKYLESTPFFENFFFANY